MNRALIAIALLSLTYPPAGTAQTTMQTASVTAPMSPHEAHDLMKSAHTGEQYKQLAGYFHGQEAKYRTKANAAKVEWDRRAQVKIELFQRYPRPVDRAQRLYESYVADANSAALKAGRYDQLAADSLDMTSNSPQPRGTSSNR